MRLVRKKKNRHVQGAQRNQVERSSEKKGKNFFVPNAKERRGAASESDSARCALKSKEGRRMR